MRGNTAGMAALCVLAAWLGVHAAPAADERPDFSGIWEPETWSTDEWPQEPPYSEAGEAAQREWAENPEDDPSYRCIIPLGRIISAPLPHEIIHEEERLVMLYEYDHQVRRVYLDGREHPESYPTLMGHSIGWWEDEELVIETANLEPGFFRPQGVPYTGDLRLIERLRLLDGGERLRAEIRIEDPEYYREPWSVTKHYSRSDEEIKDYECIIREHVSAAPQQE